MTTPNQNIQWSYAGDGATVAFAYDNKIFAATDLAVYLDGVLQVAGYSVSIDGDGIGNVTFDVAPEAAVSVVLTSAIPALQSTDFVNGEAFDADGAVEASFDRVMRVNQQIGGALDSMLRLQDGDPALSIGRLPLLSTLLDSYLGFDGAGNPVGLAAPADTTAVSSYVAPALLAADLDALLTSLGLTANARAMAAAADYAAMRTLLSLGTAALVNTGALGAAVIAAAAAYPAGDGSAITGLIATKVYVDVYTSSDTWTKRAGLLAATSLVWPPGGSGVTATGGNDAPGGGGGGFDEGTFQADDLGATEVITIGAPGAAVTVDDTDGNDGGQSSFGSLVVVNGGKGGLFPGAGGDGGGVLNATSEDFLGGIGDGNAGNHSKRGGGAGGGDGGNPGGNSEDGAGGGGGADNGGGAAGGTAPRAGDGGPGNHAGNASDGGFPGGGGGGAHGSGNDSGAGGGSKIIVISYVG